MKAYPNFGLEFILNASAYDIGAVLFQVPQNGQEHVIVYSIKSLTIEEQCYCITRRKLLAMASFTSTIGITCMA